MVTGRSRNLALVQAIAPRLLWLLAALSPIGCSQGNPFTARSTSLGSLKASVSQLEFENQKLRKEVAELKDDNTRLDTQLAQEQDANNEKSARLDDAKDLIRRQGGGKAQSQAITPPSRNFEDDGVPPPVVTPRTRPIKNGRKPPAVEIKQAMPTTPFGSGNDDLGYEPTPQTPKSLRDLGPIDLDDQERWLPIARGTGSPVRQ